MKRINDDALLNRIEFKPHKGQEPIIEAIKDPKIRDFALVCGRRFGKTYLAAYAAFRELLKPNRNIWIVAPTSNLTQKTFTYIVKFLSKVFEPGEYKITTKPYVKLTMANGTWLECKTADSPVSLIGEELDLLIIDEAARMPPMTYERELAATTMSRKGRTIFISSPRGKNWFYNKYNSIKNIDCGFAWNAPSSDNPLNTPEELEKLRLSLPEVLWKQEFLAQFIDGGAEVFRNIKDIVSDTYEEPHETHRYVMGVDLAKLRDWTVLTVVDKQTHRVVAWDRFQKIDYPLQKQRIVSLAKKYNNAKIFIDSTGVGNPITDDLKREGLIIDNYVFTNKSKIDLINKLSLFIEEKGIWIPDEPELINELEIFAIEITEGGTIKYEAPIGMNDDCVCSLALAVQGLVSTKLRQEAPPYIERKKEDKKIERIRKKKVHI